MKIIITFFLSVHALLELSGIFIILFQQVSHNTIFYFEMLNKNPAVTAIFGICAGIIRLISVYGILKNTLWGLKMSLYISMVTFMTLTFYLPYGAIDAVLATPVFIISVILGNKNAYKVKK